MKSQMLVFLWLACLGPGLLAQKVDHLREAEGDLRAARGLFEDALAKSSTQEEKTLAEVLRSLEAKAAAEGHLALAARISERVSQIEERLAIYDPERRSKRLAKAITLAPKEARFTGRVNINATGQLGLFKSTGSEATWDVRSLKPGLYEVEISYSCDRQAVEKPDAEGNTTKEYAGGEFSFGEVTGLSGVASPPFKHSVQATKDWLTPRTLSIGKIRLGSAFARLRLTSLRSKPQGLMSLYQLRLIPMDEVSASPTTTNHTSAKDSLADAEAALRKKQAGLLQLRNEALAAKAQQATAKGDSASAEAIQKMLR